MLDRRGDATIWEAEPLLGLQGRRAEAFTHSGFGSQWTRCARISAGEPVGFRQGALEDLVALRDRSVLLTGHTGFKGGWLAWWLASVGARVHGYALAPPTQPNVFDVAQVAQALASDTRADLADLGALRATLEQYRPEVVFHLAAQPLVREGYRDPLGTIASNVVGTAHVLEAIRSVASVRAVV